MDTRSKIAAAAAECLGATVVTGYFDPLLAWHAAELERIRAIGGAPLAVVVRALDNEFMPARARAEVVAALRMVDYVFADNGDLERLFAEIQPAAIVRLEDEDLRRRGELIENVRRRQTR